LVSISLLVKVQTKRWSERAHVLQ